MAGLFDDEESVQTEILSRIADALEQIAELIEEQTDRLREDETEDGEG